MERSSNNEPPPGPDTRFSRGGVERDNTFTRNPGYSLLKAAMGATEVARREGMKLANIAANPTTAQTTNNVGGSAGRTP